MTTVLISAGHGGGDPGAVYGAHRECDLALELRDMIAPKLQARGFGVDRDGAQGENLRRSVAIDKARRADVAVEIHFNGTTRTATGVECFGLASTKPLCKALSRATADVLGLGVRGGDGGWKPDTASQYPKGLGFCRAGGVLLEICWMNDKDLPRYLERKVEVADAIVEIIALHATGRLAAALVQPRGQKTFRPGTQSGTRRTAARPQRILPR